MVADTMYTYWGIMQGFYSQQKVHYMIHTCFVEAMPFIIYMSRLVHYDLLAIPDYAVSYSKKRNFYIFCFQY